VQFQIWDFPGQIDFFDGTFDAEAIFGGCGALVFVVDAQVDKLLSGLTILRIKKNTRML
jgi:Ras-related GTP-binding protein C/D